jgi:hypothetical protein
MAATAAADRANEQQQHSDSDEEEEPPLSRHSSGARSWFSLSAGGGAFSTSGGGYYLGSVKSDLSTELESLNRSADRDEAELVAAVESEVRLQRRAAKKAKQAAALQTVQEYADQLLTLPGDANTGFLKAFAELIAKYEVRVPTVTCEYRCV